MKTEEKLLFCTKSYTQKEMFEEIKKILLIPDLYNELQKYTEAAEPNKKKYLTKLKHKAYKEWHSDVRMSKDPEAERYTRCIGEALNIFKIIAENLDYFVDPISKNINIPEQEEEQDITLAEMQEKLRNSIDKIFEKAEKQTETVVVNEGTPYRDIIEEERDTKCWEASLYASIFYFVVGMLVSGIIIGVAEKAPVPIYYTISFIVLAFFAVVELICLIGIIPFSRYWFFSLNETFKEISLTTIEFGSAFFIKTLVGVENLLNKAILKSSKKEFILMALLLALAKVMFTLYIWAFKAITFTFGLIMSAFYGVALMIVGDKRFKNIVKEQTYYDGVADWYLYELFSKSEKDLSHEDKNIIYYFYKGYV